MAADIEQGVDRAVGRAAQNHRLAAQFGEEIIARILQTTDVACAEPVAQQHARQVLLEDLRIRVVGARQRVPRFGAQGSDLAHGSGFVYRCSVAFNPKVRGRYVY